MVSSTLCPAVHILGSQIVYGRAEGIADHYWPWAVFFMILAYKPATTPKPLKPLSQWLVRTPHDSLIALKPTTEPTPLKPLSELLIGSPLDSLIGPQTQTHNHTYP